MVEMAGVKEGQGISMAAKAETDMSNTSNFICSKHMMKTNPFFHFEATLMVAWRCLSEKFNDDLAFLYRWSRKSILSGQS